MFKLQAITIFSFLILSITNQTFAADKVVNIHKNNRTIDRFWLIGIQSMTTNEALNLLEIELKVGSNYSIDLGLIDSITYTEESISLPTIKTIEAEYNQENREIVCRLNLSDDGGLTILEKGICWSTSGTPTYNSNKTNIGTGTGKFYAILENVTIGDGIFIRSYALSSKGIKYGTTEKVTEFTGNVTYTLGLDRNAYPEEYELITEALDSACYYYNRYTPFQCNINIYYNAGIPTAQANYHGSIGFGPNRTYMWVGTAMHEMAHFFGSGTTTTWKNLMVNGVWQGAVAQPLCIQLTGNELHGDNGTSAVHYWPTGINYRSEVSSETDLINHAKIIKAMLVDDCKLPTVF